MKKFYSHLVEIESLTIELDEIDLADHEKHELAKLIDANIHNVIMDAIFSKLSESDKRNFAIIASSKDHEKIWKFLKSKTKDVEDEIKKAAADFKKKLHEDIKEVKKK
jgi:hypothetical protein